MFESDFKDMEGLNVLMGGWEINGESLVPTGPGENRLSFGDESWEDFELRLNAEITSGKGYGIYYLSDGKEDISGYCFQYDPGYGSGAFLVRKVEDGKEQSPIQRMWIPENFPVYNQSHEISVSIKDNNHVITVDGVEIFSFQEESFTSGSAGLRSWGSSAVSFQDVTVTGL